MSDLQDVSIDVNDLGPDDPDCEIWVGATFDDAWDSHSEVEILDAAVFLAGVLGRVAASAGAASSWRAYENGCHEPASRRFDYYCEVGARGLVNPTDEECWAPSFTLLVPKKRKRWWLTWLKTQLAAVAEIESPGGLERTIAARRARRPSGETSAS